MKKLILLSSAIFTLYIANAQNAKTYAITSQGANDYYWSNIKEIDLASGKITTSIFESDKTPFKSFDAVTKLEINNANKNAAINGLDKPFAYGVAATAFDRSHNRLYFSPMHIAQIRYIDLGTGETKFFYLPNKLVEDVKTGYLTEENQLTRMVLINKVGYAITNDGNHLFQFTTNKKPEVNDLGGLIDDASNGTISIHNKCTSWGGDIVADEDGILYLITANRHIFSIDVASRIAKHLGEIKGIPAQFTTNGAAVNDDGYITLSSANAKADLYNLNLVEMTATPVANSASNYSISDMANSNLLSSRSQKTYTSVDASSYNKFLVKNDKINVFPNPITTNQFKLSFDELQNGNYNLSVTDLQGREIYNKKLIVQNEAQIENINLDRKPISGLYFVKISDTNKKNVFVGKLMVQ